MPKYYIHRVTHGYFNEDDKEWETWIEYATAFDTIAELETCAAANFLTGLYHVETREMAA